MRALLSPLLFLAALAALVLPLRAEHRAVLVGVSDYSVLDADLNGPKNDVRLMAEVLAARGVPPAEMTVLTSDPSGLPAGARSGPPTRAAIMAALADVSARANPGDTVVFYFSGHGGQAPDQSGDEGGGYDEIFLPADAAGWKGDIGAVENAILDDELQVWAQGLLSRDIQLIGLIDACHSDTGFRGLGGAGVARGLGPADLGIPPDAASAPGDPVPPLQGQFVFLYSSQSDQRSFEYPLGDTGQWQGEFTLRLAEVLRRSPDAAWAQVLAATSAAMVQGAALQVPDGEGPLLQSAVFAAAAPQRFAVHGTTIAAGLLQGLRDGTEVALYADPAGGTALGQAILTKTTARTAQLPPGTPSAAWAEVTAPAAPPALRLAAPVQADANDYSRWRAALGPGETAADLVPILTGGTVALAGAEGVLDPFGPNSTPRIQLQPGETEAAALARVTERAAHSLRLQRLFAAVAGRSLTGTPALSLTWQAKPAAGTASGCAAPGPAQGIDPALGLHPCDQLWLAAKNTSGRDLDVSILYFNADFSITPVWPKQGLSNRLAPGEKLRAGVVITPGPAAIDQIFVLAVPAEPGVARVDLTRLAEPDTPRGTDTAGWFAATLEPDPNTASRGFSSKPAALFLLRQMVRVVPHE